MSASSKKTTHNMTLRKKRPQQTRHPKSNSEPTEGQLRHYQERKRELGARKPREERRGKLVSLDPFSLSCLVVLEMSRKFRCHLGAATHHANAPLAPKARIRARKYFLNATRTILLASLFLQTASSIQTQMRRFWISLKREETRAKKCESGA